MTRAKDISKILTAPVFGGLTYPTTDGSANQFMKTDGSGNLSFSTVDLTALSATNLTSGTIPSARVSGAYTGITTVGQLTFGDNEKAIFGDGSDFEIRHNSATGENQLNLTSNPLEIKQSGTNSVLQLINDGTNHNQVLQILKGSTLHGSISTDTGKLKIDGIGSLELSDDGSTKLATTSSGVNITGNVAMTSDDPTITMTDSSGTNDIATIQSTSGALILTARDGSSDGEIIFKKTDGSATDETMRINQSGNVGIAHSNPDQKLTVNGHINLPTGNSYFYGAGHNVFQVDSTYTYFYGGTNGVQIRKSDNSVPLVVVNDSGRVGIGTSSPSEPLRIQSDDGGDFDPSNVVLNNALMLKNSTSGANNCITLAMATESNGEVYLSTVQNSSNNAADFVISTRDSGARAERVRITSAGNVGINESSADTKLHVSHNVAGTPLATFENTASHEASIRFKSAHSSNSDFRVGASISASNNFEIYSVGAATARLKIDSTGIVTMPNQPSFQGSSGMFSTTGSNIVASSVYHNIGNHYNTSTGVFTAPITGRYLINFFAISNGAATQDVELRINGSTSNQFAPYSTDSGQHTHISGSCIAAVSANDQLALRLNNGSIYGGSNGRHNGMSFHLLS